MMGRRFIIDKSVLNLTENDVRQSGMMSDIIFPLSESGGSRCWCHPHTTLAKGRLRLCAGQVLISSYLKSQSSDTAHLSDNQQLYFKPSRGKEALVSFELNCLQQSDVFRAR